MVGKVAQQEKMNNDEYMTDDECEVPPGTYCVLCAETEGEHDGECVPNGEEYVSDDEDPKDPTD